MKKVHIIWAIIVIVALACGYFWGKASSARSFGGGSFTGTFGSSTRRTAGGTSGGTTLTTGQITAIDSSDITLQLANGNSEIVFYSSSTAITEPTTVPASDLAVGSTVSVGGTENSDGSYTATTIQVRPAGAQNGSFGSGSAAPTAQ